ncbi:unnamed protein product, partial [Pylaiella littoralis]
EEYEAAIRIQSVFKEHRSRVQVKRRACAVKKQGLLLQHTRKVKLESRLSPPGHSALRLQRACRESRVSGGQKVPQYDPTTTKENTQRQQGPSRETPSSSSS